MKKRLLRVESLERRVVLASIAGEALQVASFEPAVEYVPMIVASGTTDDGPADRVTTDYSAVGSLWMRGRAGSFICTGTLVNDPVTIGGDEATDGDWVLTAAHCLDSNNNGRADFKAKEVTFYPDGDTANGIVAERLILHPDFDGFGRGGSVSDDIALIKLTAVAPVAPHDFAESKVPGGSEFRMVGFGLSGDGYDGYDYALGADFGVKRHGGNHFDDNGEGAGNSLNKDKIWRADFDHPTDPRYDLIGTNQLPVGVEANLGGGDSGGPSFLVEGGQVGGLAAINTFGYSVLNSTFGVIRSPFFGSGMGGILVEPYLGWINEVMVGGLADDGGGGGGGNKPCNPNKPGCSSESPVEFVMSLAADITITPDAAQNFRSGRGVTIEEVDLLYIPKDETKESGVIVTASPGNHRGLRPVVSTGMSVDDSTEPTDQILENWPDDLQIGVAAESHLD
jgi:hypothetical protein